MGFNDGGSGSDYGDWVTSGTKRVQDAFGTAGINLDIGPAELLAFDVIGYDLAVSPVPEPATVFAFGLAALGVAFGVRRRMAA